MNDQTSLTLLRDCDAIQIPSGNPLVLEKGAEVVITQSLGGSYTVATREGLAKISGKDADALGIENETSAESPSPAAETGTVTTIEEVWSQLKTCYDPEIPVNIVDLGLVYDCRLINREDSETGPLRAEVKMTLTAPGCGMGPTIAREAEQKLLSLPGVTEAAVELVWDPAWNQNMISEAGRMQLGLV